MRILRPEGRFVRRGIENLRIAGNFYGKPETNALFVIASSVINMSIVQRTPLKASQPSRWRPWLNENGSKLLLFARQQTRSLADAEDVLQEAVVKLARKVEEGTFVGGQESWLPFIYTQIRRESIDLGRKDDRRKRREGAVVDDTKGLGNDIDLPLFEEGEGNGETCRILVEGLKSLPKKFSEVITMKLWGERTFAEIGEALDISLNTAASRYRYGIEALRKQLATARLNGDI